MANDEQCELMKGSNEIELHKNSCNNAIELKLNFNTQIIWKNISRNNKSSCEFAK